MDDSILELIMGILGFLCSVSVPVGLLGVGFLAGRYMEHKHLKSLDTREKEFADMVLTDLRSFPGTAVPSQRGALVMGQVVIASDYFKSFAARLKQIIGGELRTYETLLTRARREALLRLCEDARGKGYNAVCNIRYNTSNISQMSSAKGAAMVEVLSTGTAYRIP